MEPKESEQARKMQEKLNTLIRTNILSLESIKLGLLYSSPTFAEYAPLNKTQDGKIDPKASIEDYASYANRPQKNPQNLADRAVLVSMNSLRGLNFQEILRGYQDGDLAGKLTKTNPAMVDVLTKGTVPGNTP